MNKEVDANTLAHIEKELRAKICAEEIEKLRKETVENPKWWIFLRCLSVTWHNKPSFAYPQSRCP